MSGVANGIAEACTDPLGVIPGNAGIFGGSGGGGGCRPRAPGLCGGCAVEQLKQEIMGGGCGGHHHHHC
jgi:hypothetical protein